MNEIENFFGYFIGRCNILSFSLDPKTNFECNFMYIFAKNKENVCAYCFLLLIAKFVKILKFGICCRIWWKLKRYEQNRQDNTCRCDIFHAFIGKNKSGLINMQKALIESSIKYLRLCPRYHKWHASLYHANKGG